MKKLLFLITVLIIAFLAVSCSDQPQTPGKVYFCTVALDYEFLDKNHLNTEIDQRRLISEFKELGEVSGTQVIIKPFCCFKNSPEYLGESDVNYVTKAMIRDYIYELEKEVEENDVFIFHYSGHGGENGEILVNKINPEETSSRDIKVLIDEDFKPSDLLGWINRLKCNKVLMMDCCFSGKYVTNSGLYSGDSFRTDTNINKTVIDYWEGNKLMQSVKNAVENFGKPSDSVYKKLWVLAACTDKQEAREVSTKDSEDKDVEAGPLSLSSCSYFGYNSKDEKANVYENTRFTVNGIYEYMRKMIEGINYYGKSLTYYSTPQSNTKPVDLVLFRT